MPKDPMVTFVVTLTVSEDGDALAGQGGVFVNGELLQELKLDREHLEVPYAIAAQHAIDACRDWLKIQAATKELAAPSTQPRRVKKTQGKSTVSRGVSRSRLR